MIHRVFLFIQSWCRRTANRWQNQHKIVQKSKDCFTMKLKLPAMATFTGGENRLSPAEKENLGCSNIDSKICLYIWDCLLQVLAMGPLLLVLLPVHASVLDLLQMPNFISSECLLIVRYGAFTDSNSSYCRTQLGTGKVSQTVKRS